MVFGEHAVLYGRAAIVGAVGLRVRVNARPLAQRRLVVRSPLGAFEGRLFDSFPPPPEHRFAVLAARHAANQIPDGVELNIESDFSPAMGLGSSAAVTVAILAALQIVAGRSPDPVALLDEARRLVRQAQGGVGSGADVAASVYGGLCLYRMSDACPERLPRLPPLTVVYAGYKTPTPEVIRRVEAWRKNNPAFYESLFDDSERITTAAAEGFRQSSWAAIGSLMNKAQLVLERLGVSDHTLTAIVTALRSLPGILGAKISGSGLGDCVIGLGATAVYRGPGHLLAVRLTDEGVRWG